MVAGPGAVLYQSNCSSCHGADLCGADEGPISSNRRRATIADIARPDPVIAAVLLSHSDGAGATHMGTGSIWAVLSMIAFSLFLLAFAWSLLRPIKHSPRTPADVATERYAHGKIDVDDFEHILGDTKSRPR
jgi:hypothetical protein